MNFIKEQQDVARKYKRGTCRYYLHLWAKIVKSLYHHKHQRYSFIERGNYVPYIPASCSIRIFGQNNTVEIDPSIKIFTATICMGDPENPVRNCTLKIGKNSTCSGANIKLFESDSAVYIGENCMLSYDIEIWASDAHSIIEAQRAELLNWSKEVVIGNHVWVGMHAIILKNSHISDDCIIGAGAVVAGTFKESHAVLAGNPAKVIKTGISWDSLRPMQYQEKFQHNGKLKR